MELLFEDLRSSKIEAICKKMGHPRWGSSLQISWVLYLTSFGGIFIISYNILSIQQWISYYFTIFCIVPSFLLGKKRVICTSFVHLGFHKANNNSKLWLVHMGDVIK